MIANKVTPAPLLVLATTLSCLLFSTQAGALLANEPILPIPFTIDLNSDKVALGKILFYDKRLSRNKTLSCASCHKLESGGDDGKVFGTTHDGNVHVINTPTIFNAVYNFRQGWDGSARTLAEQINETVKNPLEANNSWNNLLDTLMKDDKLTTQFRRIFKRNISREDYIDVLSEYLKSLTTPNSRFDQYLRGDDIAISNQEKQGYKLFKDFGCIACHQGVNIGGNLFQELGVFYDYFAARGNVKRADYGRMNVTNRKKDMYVFKVPSLRNVELTAPYLHDGHAKTLEEAVIIMGETELGREMKANEIQLIVKFMKTLTGIYKEYASDKVAQ